MNSAFYQFGKQFIHRMTNHSYYLSQPHRRVSKLLESLSQNEIDNTNKFLKDLLNKKKSKLRELYSLSSHEILQPRIVPAKSEGPFMSMVPMTVVEEFLDEKVKANILKPDRFYTKKPNMKAGSFTLPKRVTEEDRNVIAAQFDEFNRVVDQQSGEFRQKKLMKLLSVHEQVNGKQKYTRMKRTLFQKFIPDKYNFYNNPTSLKKNSTIETSLLKRSQSKHLRSEQSIDLKESRNEIPLSSKQVRTVEISEMYANARNNRKTSILQKSRINTMAHQIEKYQKNLNSLG